MFIIGDHVKRLWQSVETSRRRLEPFREQRLAALRQYVGHWYGDNGTKLKTPVNLLNLMISIYCRLLSSGEPRVLVRTPLTDVRPRASKLELAENLVLDKIGFGDNFRAVILEAMFYLSVMKIAPRQDGQIEMRNELYPVAGLPFADPISPDDWVHDTDAKRWDHIQFAGDRYTVPLDWARDNREYDAKVRGKLEEEDKRVKGNVDLATDFAGSGEGAPQDTSYRPRTALLDLWLPDEGILLTLPDDGSSSAPLREWEWEGPPQGPYRALGFGDVPDNIMSLSPASARRDLHELVNLLFNKISRRAKSHKKLPYALSTAKKTAERLNKANDGEWAIVDSMEVGTWESGGVDPRTFAFMLQAKDLFSFLSGNLDALGGLGPQSDTLGQDKLLATSAGTLIAKLQERTIKFASNVLRDIAHWLWTDPSLIVSIVKPVEGADFGISSEFGPADRVGSLDRFQISVEPYSLQMRTPEMRLQRIQNVFQNIIMPLAPMMEMQGGSIDAEKFLRLIARYGDMPELNDIVTFAGSQGEGGGGDRPLQSPVTRRENVRVNRGTATREGKERNLISTLMGAGVQSKEPVM